jgi:uncharacterized SAM-binding protein YcdF (DUF218 family)
VFTLGLAAAAFAAFLASMAADARSFRNAVLLGLALALAALGVTERLIDMPGRREHLLLLALAVLVAVGPFVVACYLVANGITMMRKERVRPASLLPLVAAGAILAVIGLDLAADQTGSVQLGLLATVSTLVFGYVSFLAISAGLAARGGRPVMIVSGGQGSDEEVPEARAMAGYLIERGFPDDRLAVEDQSGTTEENLAFSKAIMDAAGGPRPARRPARCLIVTSDYHVFRTAMTARKVGIRGHVKGARTAGYFWPSAMLREFIAVFVGYWMVNLGICAALVLAPVAYAVSGRL